MDTPTPSERPAAPRVLRAFLSPDERAALGELAARASAGFSPGRQQSGYETLALEPHAEVPPWLAALTARALAAMGERAMVGWDRYLLRYRVGACVPPHVDPPLHADWRHLRFNALVRAADGGGVLVLDGVATPLAAGDAVLFRPDRARHEVTRVEAGERAVFSVGCNYVPGA